MKKILLLFLLFVTIKSHSQNIDLQVENLKINKIKENPTLMDRMMDSTLQVFYSIVKPNDLPVEYFVNGKFVGKTVPTTLEPNNIKSMDVLKKDTILAGEKFSGQIFIITKNDYIYTPRLISLSNLKQKYTNIKYGSCMFYIDDQLINSDYTIYQVDENNLLRIFIEYFENKKENLSINLIYIVTKTQENLENIKHPKIMIR